MTANVNDSELSRLDPYPNQLKKSLLCMLGRHKWKPVNMEWGKKGQRLSVLVVGEQCIRKGCHAERKIETMTTDRDLGTLSNENLTVKELGTLLKCEFAKLREDVKNIEKLQQIIDYWRKELGIE